VRVERTGTSSPAVIAKWTGNNKLIKAILLDGDYVYWAATDSLQAGADATVYRAPKCAAGAPASVIVAAHPGNELIGNLLAAASYLYYGALDDIRRFAK
jgi:hypothetical protein